MIENIDKKFSDLLSEARRERQRIALSIYLDCIMILGSEESLELIFEDPHHSGVYIVGKKEINGNLLYRRENADMLVGINRSDTAEEYFFSNTFNDEGAVMKNIYLDQKFPTKREQIGKIGLEKLQKEIRESKQYKIVAPKREKIKI